MEKVTGIGGMFFRARNPQSLAEWYRDHLGVSPVPENYDDLPWLQHAPQRLRLFPKTPVTSATPANSG
jgi:hypothetical protein